MTRTIRKYTDEFKQEAVNLAIKSPNIAQVARELDIPSGTLHTWIQDMHKKQSTASNASNQMDIAKLLEENRRLHKELAIAKEEKDILKKAAAYFAQHQK